MYVSVKLVFINVNFSSQKNFLLAQESKYKDLHKLSLNTKILNLNQNTAHDFEESELFLKDVKQIL